VTVVWGDCLVTMVTLALRVHLDWTVLLGLRGLVTRDTLVMLDSGESLEQLEP